MYADDCILSIKNRRSLLKACRNLKEISLNLDLAINYKKSTYMITRKKKKKRTDAPDLEVFSHTN